MIQQTDISWQTQSWQSLLQSAVTDVGELCRILDLDSNSLPLSELAQQEFPLRAPLPFVNRMERGNPKDPLLLQILAVQQETLESPGLVNDPLQEADHNPLPGLLHKYRNRVLLTVATSCAVHCRYCFRRHFNYEDNNGGRSAWPAILHYLQDHSEVDEVILSGGDPLMANDAYLDSLIEKLASIKHVQRLRIHTRLPVVIPQRILQSDLSWLNHFANPLVVLHINHANEIDAELQMAVSHLKAQGATVLNQAVLLAGINDELESQIELHRRSFDAGILPYYLHMPDQVRGTAHFQVSEGRGRELMAQMQTQLSGYMVPNLVVERPGHPGKTRLL